MIVSNKIYTFILASATSAGVIVAEAPGAFSSADSVVTWLLGAGFSTLLAANIGAFLAMLIAEPIRPQTRMWALFAAVSLLSSAGVALIPFVPGFGWLAKAPPQAIAVIFAFFGRWGIPAAYKYLPGLIGSRMGAKDNGGDQ